MVWCGVVFCLIESSFFYKTWSLLWLLFCSHSIELVVNGINGMQWYGHGYGFGDGYGYMVMEVKGMERNEMGWGLRIGSTTTKYSRFRSKKKLCIIMYGGDEFM